MVMRVALYARCSTDDQDNSKQITTARDWAASQGYPEPEIHQETGRRHQGLKKPILAALLARIDQYDILVVENLDRLGFQDPLELMHILYRLREANCELWIASEHRQVQAQDIAGLVLTSVQGESSREEGRNKARRHLTRARDMAREGLHLGGQPPFALDLVCEGFWRARMIGRKKWLVTATDEPPKVFDGYLPARPPGSKLRWLPTEDPETLEAARTLFRLADEGWPLHRIARHLNQHGPRHPLGRWYAILARRLLQNPAYIGLPTWGKTTRAAYARWVNGQVQHVDRPLHRNIRTEAEDWLQPPAPVYEPIVEPELFARVQARLMEPARYKAPRSPNCWLAGLLICQSCGLRMVAWNHHKQKPSYVCQTYRRYGKENDCGCRSNMVRHEVLVPFVEQYLNDIGTDLAALRDSSELALSQSLDERSRQANSSLRDTIQHLRERALEELGADALPGLAPNTSLADLWEAVSLAENATRGKRAARRRDLQRQLSRLVEGYADLRGQHARRIAQEKIDAIEAELNGLDEAPEYARQLRELMSQLTRARILLARAKREGDPAARSRALKGLLERIVVRFKVVPHGPQLHAKPAEITFYPLAPEEEPRAYSAENRPSPP